VAYDQLLQNNCRAILTHFGVNYAEGNANPLHAMMRHPLSALGLSDAGAHVRFIADAGMHSYLLSRWVRDTAPGSAYHVPLEVMVKKLSSANAALFGFADRGALLPGLRADLNLIDLGALATAAPTMVYDLPAGMPRLTEQVSGYVGTLVKGEFVTEQGAETGARPGRVLRGGQSAR